jgi:hypothetical protein
MNQLLRLSILYEAIAQANIWLEAKHAGDAERLLARVKIEECRQWINEIAPPKENGA